MFAPQSRGSGHGLIGSHACRKAARMTEASRGYRRIGDYALIGDAHSVALIASDGSIDWYCCPRFDSPAVFCRLLDAGNGGYYRVGPTTPHTTSRSYVGETNVLATTFTTDTGRIRVTDLMPMGIDTGRGRASTHESHRILRLIEGVAGAVECEVRFRPTFRFASGHTEVQPCEGGAVARARDEWLVLACSFPLHNDVSWSVSGRKTIVAGDRVSIAMTYHARRAPDISDFDLTSFDDQLEGTLRYWRSWSDGCTYDGPYHALVRRSALALKLLTFAPTGALLAAPTTSLPEVVGGVGNWDYRYTWLRDAAMSLDALMLIGYHEEAERFFDWLENLCLRCTGGLQIMYAIDGEPTPAESTLDHLEGYRASRPVRVGNGAGHQTQLDVYGHVIDAVSICHERRGVPIRAELWSLLRQFADQAAARWREPDHGPWEVRGERRHYLYTKLFCWVALDRAMRIAEQRGESGRRIERWRGERDELRGTILERGFDAHVGAFTYVFDDPTLDAGALVVPLVNFLSPNDSRVRATMLKVREQLSVDGLVYRNFTPEFEGEGTFTLCSCWLAENLILAGRLDEARTLFERIAGHASDLGLLSEEIDAATGQLLGNYPQGYSHLALIRTAVRLAQAESSHAKRPKTRAKDGIGS